MTVAPERFGWDDPDDAWLVRSAAGVLGVFNEAGVLAPADVHVARTLGALTGETAEDVLLAAALAARGPRLGHVCVDLTTVGATAQSEQDETADLRSLPWPEPAAWVEAVAGSPLVALEAAPEHEHRPLRLAGVTLYLDRYWRHELAVARELLERGVPCPGVDTARLAAGLARLLPDEDQRQAGAATVLRRLSVLAGGPGTGKTTTVARVLALLHEQAAASGRPPPRVALAAPTGKAAARLAESVHEEASRIDVEAACRAWLRSLPASTIHRLLGWRPDSASRFRHDRGNRLAVDTVVVDETSMVSLSQMARLLEAVRPDARLVLVGDPDQLSSVEAGAVLADVVGPATAEPPTGPASRGTPPAPGIGDGIVVLRRVRRFGGAIAEVAAAIRAGDAERTVRALRSGGSTAGGAVTWAEAGEADAVQGEVVAAAASVLRAARRGDAPAALAALGRVRVLCAHRLGPHGVATWTERIEAWLADGLPGYGTGGTWYPGRPLLVTRNDYSLGLYNGDVGVVVESTGGRPVAAFERQGQVAHLPVTRLEAVETVHAMTIHKSQGSQFATVAVVLPDPDARILTRELLYTAVTRARRRVVLLGSEAAVRAAVERPVARASGLGRRLWAAPAGGPPVSAPGC